MVYGRTRTKWISKEIQHNSQEPVSLCDLEPGMNVIYVVFENLRISKILFNFQANLKGFLVNHMDSIADYLVWLFLRKK